MEIFVVTFAALFSVLNPFGAVPVFLSLTPDYTRAERRTTAMHTAIYVVLILLSFFIAGSTILQFFGISIPALTIAGGIIMGMSGFALLNGKFAESRAMNKKVRQEALHKEDISFTPMAMPMLSGPGSISMLITTYTEYPILNDRLIIGGMIISMGLVIFLILQAAPVLFRVLGQGGLKAVARIMGFLVIAIGIQYIVNGIILFLENSGMINL